MRPTSKSSPLALIAMFALGACTTVALQSSASNAADEASDDAPDASEAPPPSADVAASVVALDEAKQATAPSGKATITHLARGHNAYLGRLRMDAGGAVPAHRDPTEEYIHILSGAGTITIDGQAYEVGPGATIFMPANAEVSYQNGDEEMVALQIFAGPEPASKYEGWTAVD